MADLGTIVLLLAPVIVGGLVVATDASQVNEATERAEAWLRRQKERTASSAGRFGRYVVHPFLWTILRFFDHSLRPRDPDGQFI